MLNKEIKEIKANQKIMVSEGRLKNVMLNKGGELVSLTELRKNFLAELEQTAEALDEYSEGYLDAFYLETNKNKLPSEKILNDMESNGFEFKDYALNQSKIIAENYNSFDSCDFSALTNSAQASIEKLRILEESSSMEINKYVELYNSKNLGIIMKALQCVELAGPEKLIFSEIDDPKPGNGEVLIEIKAASVNFPDVLMIQGLYQNQPPMPFIPGAECSGVIIEIGEGVNSCAEGDRVFVMAGTGCFAEKLVVDATRIASIPSTMDFPVAAALPMTYGTSLYALKQRANLQPGETLLVLGAAGGLA